jgi:hypothetical protein
VQDLLWVVQQLNAAADALHEAADRESAVRRLQREALDRLNTALEMQDQAAEAVRRSDRLRADVIGVLLAPHDPSGL